MQGISDRRKLEGSVHGPLYIFRQYYYFVVGGGGSNCPLNYVHGLPTKVIEEVWQMHETIVIVIKIILMLLLELSFMNICFIGVENWNQRLNIYYRKV